ncbi:anthranilate synthase component I [Actinobacillus equuli]|nr:anthranilate synthase component I [Actinobacillus equuli]
MSATFPPIAQNLDEDSKLKTSTVFDGLRCMSRLFADKANPIYLGGLFSYDLVAHFIPMDGIQLQDDGLRCHDYSFYLAEQLVFIDHQNRNRCCTLSVSMKPNKAIYSNKRSNLAKFLQISALRITPTD